MNTDNLPSRSRIARAALAEFAEHGYAGARVARIASRAKLNKQLVFYYFGSKAKLYETLMTEAGQTFREQYRALLTDNGRHATERIRSLIAAVLYGLDQRPHLLHLIIQDSALTGTDRRVSGGFLEDLEDSFARVISEGQGIGYFRDDIDPRLIAAQAVRLLLGHAILKPVQSHDHAASVDGIARLLLRSLAW